MAGECKKSGRRRDLEIGDWFSLVEALALFERRLQLLLGNQATRKSNSFVKPDEMWRRIGMNLQPLRLEHRARKGAHRALSVGASDMNNWRNAALGMIERRQKPPNPVESEIDLVWMKGGQASEYSVTLQCGRAHAVAEASPLVVGFVAAEPFPRPTGRCALPVRTAGPRAGCRGRCFRRSK